MYGIGRGADRLRAASPAAAVRRGVSAQVVLDGQQAGRAVGETVTERQRGGEPGIAAAQLGVKQGHAVEAAPGRGVSQAKFAWALLRIQQLGFAQGELRAGQRQGAGAIDIGPDRGRVLGERKIF